jgi:hypothetical protein
MMELKNLIEDGGKWLAGEETKNSSFLDISVKFAKCKENINFMSSICLSKPKKK